MWAALKSPLLMGNDLRNLSSAALTILNNPAVIAINQDPLSKSVNLLRRSTEGLRKDKYGMGETHVWGGHLSNGDEVVILFNAADEDVDMSASLAEIFYADGAEGSAKQVQETWDVYDLWANRMDDETAQELLDTDDDMDSYQKLLHEANWYNATALSYEEGLKAGDARLFGKNISRIHPRGSLKAKVKRHSAEMFRLRSVKTNATRSAI